MAKATRPAAQRLPVTIPACLVAHFDGFNLADFYYAVRAAREPAADMAMVSVGAPALGDIDGIDSAPLVIACNIISLGYTRLCVNVPSHTLTALIILLFAFKNKR